MVISPYVVVPGTQPKVPVKFEYADESDPGPYPIPRDAPIEGGEKSQGDRHVLVIDRDHGRLYELLPRQPRSAHILAADSVRQQPIAAPEESEINCPLSALATPHAAGTVALLHPHTDT